MNTFNYGYDKYIYIKNPQTELIFQKLFKFLEQSASPLSLPASTHKG